MAETDLKTAALAELPLFAGCRRRQLERLGSICDKVTAASGAVVVAEGSTGVEFFVIEKGSAEVQSGGAVLARLGPGDFFGELALLGKDRILPRSGTVVATEPLELYVFDMRGFASMLGELPDVAERIREEGRRRSARNAAKR
jgi:CRP/FNR family transcriptional regulator, cyclic AMP receptor protein